MYRFLIVLEKANGNYSVYCPDLPGCVATGKTQEEAERNMHEAVKMHIEGMMAKKNRRKSLGRRCAIRSRKNLPRCCTSMDSVLNASTEIGITSRLVQPAQASFHYAVSAPIKNSV